MDYDAAHLAFKNQAVNARKKKVPFDITFKEWCDIWAPHIHERGRLQLQRIEKHLGYVPGNLRIAPAPSSEAVMHIELTPFTSVMRLYDDPDGYEKRLPYKAALMVRWDSATEVLLCVAMGEIGPKVWTLAMAKLKEQGVTKVTFERHGKLKTYEI